MHPLPLSARLTGGNVTPQATPLTPATTRPARLRIGLLLPVWYLGGVERYHLALARWTGPAIEWVGCAFTAGALVKQESLDALAAVMPIHMDCHNGGQDARWNVIRHQTEQAAIDAITDNADVLLTWAVQELDGRLANFRGRVVVISHGDGQWTRSWARSAERWAECVAVSREAARAFDTPFVTLLPGGVELDRLAPTQSREDTRQALGIWSRYAVGFVGRFSPEKNPLAAAKIVGQLGPDYVAVYHGHNPFGEAEFRAEATREARGRIIFAGTEWHTGDIYAALDCLVQMSPAEGGPLVAMEAAAAGVPLISTAVGIVRDDQELADCCYLVEADDFKKAAAAVMQATKRPPSNEARQLAVGRYSAAAMARRWEEFLDRSKSGPGSTMRATVAIRERLPGILQALGVKSILDAPCGDLHWISRTDLQGIDYTGADISAEQIEANRRRFPGRQFQQLDLVADPLPKADAVICRDCLVHLPTEAIKRAIANIVASGARVFVSTTFPGRENVEIKPGTWQEAWRPIDLQAEPFNLPAPIEVINERCRYANGEFSDKALAVWQVADIARKWRP